MFLLKIITYLYIIVNQQSESLMKTIENIMAMFLLEIIINIILHQQSKQLKTGFQPVALEKDPAGHGEQSASDDRVAPAP